MLTTENLKKMGFLLVSKCPLCCKAEEELIHLLFHCPSIRGLWEGLFSIPGIAWVYPYSIKELFMGWNFFPIGKKARKLLRAVPICLLWEIWKERNRIAFDDVFVSITRLKSSFVSMLLSWARCMEVEEGSLAIILLYIL